MAQKETKLAWQNVEERLALKLTQLTKLMEHFGSYPSNIADIGHQALAEQNDTEIEEILKETSCRIRIFKEELEVQSQYEKIRQVVKDAKEREESIKEAADQQFQTLSKKILELKSELADQSQKLKEASLAEEQQLHVHSREHSFMGNKKLKLQQEQEIEEERKRHKEEVAVIIDRCQRQVEATQQVFADRQVQSQDEARREITQSIEVLKAVHAEEIEQMKMENKDNVAKLCKKHAAAESRHKDQEVSLRKKLENADLEKDKLWQEVHSLREQLREAHDMVQATTSTLAQDRDVKHALEVSYSSLKNENSLAMERLRVSLRDVQSVCSTLESEKKKTVDLKAAYTSTISALESKTLALQKEVTNITTACMLTEDELKQSKKKVDELQLALATSRKDHSNSITEIKRLQEEMRVARDALSKLETEMRRKDSEAIAKSNALSAEVSALQLERLAQSEQSANHVKELMELKLKKQMSNYESTMSSVQRAFLMQLDEQKKGAKVQYASLEESLRKKWKESETKAKDDYAKFAQAFESRLEQQRANSTELISSYETKVSKLQEELEILESTGISLETEFKAVQKQAAQHAQNSKQVCSALTRQLKDSQRKCDELHQSWTALQEKSQARDVKQAARIEELIAQVDQYTKAATLSAKQERSYLDENKRLKQTILDMQVEHDKKLEGTMQSYEMDVSELRRQWDTEKEAECDRLEDELKWRFHKETAELHDEVKSLQQQNESLILEKRAALQTAAENIQKLVMAHQLELEVGNKEKLQKRNLQMLSRKSEQDLEMAKSALGAAVAEVSEKARLESLTQRNEFGMQLQSIVEKHKEKVMQNENEWRAKLETKASKENMRHETELAEVRRTMRRWFGMEKEQIMADNKRTVCQLESHIVDLEKSVTHQERKLSQLCAENKSLKEQLCRAETEIQGYQEVVKKSVPAELLSKSLEEQSSVLQKDFTSRAAESQSENAAQLDACREQHRLEMACIRQELESTKDSLQRVQTELQKLQERFENKESNPADLRYIAELQSACEKKDAQYHKLFEEARTLRLEIVNREENYNKVFGNSPTVLHGVAEWIKPKNKEHARKTGSSGARRLSTPDRSSNRTPEGSSRTS